MLLPLPPDFKLNPTPGILHSTAPLIPGLFNARIKKRDRWIRAQRQHPAQPREADRDPTYRDTNYASATGIQAGFVF